MMDAMQKLGVQVILGERVVTWPEEPESLDRRGKIIRTDKGRQFEADIIVCLS